MPLFCVWLASFAILPADGHLPQTPRRAAAAAKDSTAAKTARANPSTTKAFDYGGAVVFALAMLLLLLSVNRGNDWGWGSPAILGCAVGSGLLCVLLYAIEGRAVNPIIPSFLFTDRTIAIANFLPMPCGMAYHLRLLHILYRDRPCLQQYGCVAI